MSNEWVNDGRNRHAWPFCGVDGEGGNIPDPSALFGTVHSYLLLRAGEFAVENPAGLGFEDCASFLCSLPANRIYVAYFFDYDVTMIIKSLPEERARRLLNRSIRHREGYGNPLPVQFAGYDFDYLPHKEFRIRISGTKDWTIISDVGQFFQTTFYTTLEKWGIGTPVQREMIRKGKSMRASFEGVTDEIRAYNALEILLLQDLMASFRAVCVDTGYIPRKWQGPGFLASAMLDYHHIPRRKAIPILSNEEFKRLANDAYYGGRFETTACGPIAGPVFQYDINSAYPSTLRSLPCLSHGSWKQVRDLPENGQLWFGQVYFNHDTPALLYNLPIRDKNGNIHYPREGNGVYWSSELEAAAKAGTHLSFSTGWVFERHCDCRLWDFIDDYYERRLSLGKSAKGYVLKLAGNSIYGKLAQSIGYAPFANPVWAGLITAGCRAQIIEAYSRCPQQTYMIATDGIFTGQKLDLQISRRLGEWEETEHENGIFIVQPGIYFLPGGDVKTRGIERGRINNRREDFEVAWRQFMDSQGVNYTVTVDVDNFITAKQSLARNKWQLAGTWEKATRDVSFEWGIKRQRTMAIDDGRAIRTVPHRGSRDLMSTGYPLQIGGEVRPPGAWLSRFTDPGLQERERMEEQPDWVTPLIVT